MTDQPITYSGLAAFPKTAAGAIQLYDSWANSYDETLKSWKYPAPQRVAEILSDYYPQRDMHTKVLDMGCGTGLSGEALRGYNFTNLSGIDISQVSLDLIKNSKPGLYTELKQGSLDESLHFESSSFSAVISVGVFSYVENFTTLFTEVVRICKSEGVVVFTHRTQLWDDDFRGCRSAAEFLEIQGKWRSVYIGEPEEYMPQNPDPAESIKTIRIIVYRCL
eukprot:CAMPEP_0185036270 /NCGR_PEP_ID=MMETSP1103-20130426/28991_1 /TAXON_ID=36769 /ORGANISM="Paraphysomonas bandaiensis, Strain Caron Lab Isolate" /LENGTH=220 /DNA_ID=CAMNT_0027573755 /DNA_START=69 /DNA_END=731 /DNA_ORIENTATION=+